MNGLLCFDSEQRVYTTLQRLYTSHRAQLWFPVVVCCWDAVYVRVCVCVCLDFWAHDTAFWDLLCCVTIVTVLKPTETEWIGEEEEEGAVVFGETEWKKPEYKHVVRSESSEQLSLEFFKEVHGLSTKMLKAATWCHYVIITLHSQWLLIFFNYK